MSNLPSISPSFQQILVKDTAQLAKRTSNSNSPKLNRKSIEKQKNASKPKPAEEVSKNLEELNPEKKKSGGGWREYLPSSTGPGTRKNPSASTTSLSDDSVDGSRDGSSKGWRGNASAAPRISFNPKLQPAFQEVEFKPDPNMLDPPGLFAGNECSTQTLRLAPLIKAAPRCSDITVYKIVKKQDCMEILSKNNYQKNKLMATFRPKTGTIEDDKTIFEIFDGENNEIGSVRKKAQKPIAPDGVSPAPISPRLHPDSLKLYTNFPLHPEQEARKIRTRTGPKAVYNWAQITLMVPGSKLMGGKGAKFIMEVSSRPERQKFSIQGEKPKQAMALPKIRLPLPVFGGNTKSTNEGQLPPGRHVQFQGKSCALVKELPKEEDNVVQEITVQPYTDPILMILFLAATNQLY